MHIYNCYKRIKGKSGCKGTKNRKKKKGRMSMTLPLKRSDVAVAHKGSGVLL